MCLYEFCIGSFSCPPTDAARDETMQIWRLKLASGELEAAADYIYGLTFSRCDVPNPAPACKSGLYSG